MQLKHFALFLPLLSAAPTTEASILTYRVEGAVATILKDDINHFFGAAFSVGDVITGTYSIDTNAAPTFPRPTFARYGGSSFDLMIGTQRFFGTAEHRVFNDDLVGSPIADVFSIINETGSYTSPAIGDLISSTFFMQFFDHTSSVFSNTNPVLNPILSDYNQQINGLRLDSGTNAGDYGALYFTINSIQRLPEPTTLATFSLGLLALSFFRPRAKGFAAAG